MFDEFGINAGYVEDLHTRWLQSPHSVEEDWRRFFEGLSGPSDRLSVTGIPSPTVAKNGQPSSHVKTVKASKPVKPADPAKTHKQVAHVVKSSKVIAN